MNTVTILEFIGAVLASLGAIWSLLQVIWKLRAKTELRRKLEKDVDNKVEQLRNLTKHLSTYSSDAEKLREAQALLEEQLMSLKEPHRKLILEGLHQPSERGRANYIVKLLTDAFASRATLKTASPN